LISVAASFSADSVQMWVSDRGPGIARADLNLIFEKFHRDINTSGIAGVGLGLTICRAIIELHGGRIWAQSAQQNGTAIHFTLPRTGQMPTQPSAETD
jgi:two-component system sensor histidine kinase KdpD